jgi:hypothetical protein
MAKTMKLALRPNSQAPYTVGVRDKKGKVKRAVRFEPGVALDADNELLAAAYHTIGPALVVAKESADDPSQVVFDWSTTRRIRDACRAGKPISDALNDTGFVVEESSAPEISVSPAANHPTVDRPQGPLMMAPQDVSGQSSKQAEGAKVVQPKVVDTPRRVIEPGDSPVAGEDLPETESEDPQSPAYIAPENVALDDEVVDILSAKGDVFGEFTPQAVGQWILDGGDLTALGLTDEQSEAVKTALAVNHELGETEGDGQDDSEASDGEDADTNKSLEPVSPDLLIAAGLDKDLAGFLVQPENVAKHGVWLGSPDGIKLKVASGFDLRDLTDIGKGRADQIKKELKITEPTPKEAK